MNHREIRFEMIDDEMAAVLRQKTGAEKMKIADAMFRSAQILIAVSVRMKNPNWSDERVQSEVSRRTSGAPK